MMDNREGVNLFDFGLNENNEYVNLKEEKERWEEEYYKEYTFEELISGYEENDDFVIIATFYVNGVDVYGYALEQIQEDIKNITKTKTYHFGNLNKGIYAYSYKITYDNGDYTYWFLIENEQHIVMIRHIKEINDVLTGKEQLCYPACCVYLFGKTENGTKPIKTGYGDKENDIRYKILCGEFKILEFSTNRIYPNKKPTDFCEAQYDFRDFVKYWGDQ